MTIPLLTLLLLTLLLLLRPTRRRLRFESMLWTTAQIVLLPLRAVRLVDVRILLVLDLLLLRMLLRMRMLAVELLVEVLHRLMCCLGSSCEGRRVGGGRGKGSAIGCAGVVELRRRRPLHVRLAGCCGCRIRIGIVVCVCVTIVSMLSDSHIWQYSNNVPCVRSPADDALISAAGCSEATAPCWPG